MARKKKTHRYRNILLLVLSVLVAVWLSQNQTFQSLVMSLGEFGYFGAFLGGVLFVSTFTVSLGTLLLVLLVNYLSVFEIALLGGLGALVGDLLIFRYVRGNSLMDEIKKLYKYFGGHRVTTLLHTPYFSWTLPVLGAIIIASPLPDELGVSLLGISKMKTYEFMALSFVLNSIGILVVVSSLAAL